jgi:hypothetical protein
LKARPVLHPLLFALFPILFLYAHNMSELYLSQLALPLPLAAAAAAIVWLGLALGLRDTRRAALVSSLFLVWFFLFGHLRGLVAPRDAGLESTNVLIFVALYWMLLMVGAGLLIVQRRELRGLSSALNVAAVVLVAFQLVVIGGYEASRALASRRVQQAAAIGSTTAARGVPPNIYCIVLDGYARADVLRDIYHFDNSPFLDYLRHKGFAIARRGRANYSQTILSLASCLNMTYLDEVAAQVGRRSTDRAPLARMIQRNRLFTFLRRRGYHTVAFASGYSPVDIHSADIYIDAVPGLTEFQRVILNTTPLPLVLPAPSVAIVEHADAKRILYIFDHLADTTKLKPPIFVFAHILSPHPPFVFDHNGRIIGREVGFRLDRVPGMPVRSETTGYVEQLRFVNRKTQATVAQLLARSTWPTVIVVESDHGASLRTDWDRVERTDVRERLGSLMAVYLPGDGDRAIPDDLSDVNVFRLVLNRYLGADLPLLPNESYYSPWRYPYEFTRVTSRVDSPAGR